MLLSADLVPGAADAIADGLEGLANWAQELDDFDELSKPLPLIDTPLGELLDLGDFIQENLVNPLNDIVDDFNANPDVNTTAELATELSTALGSLGSITDITGNDEYRFSLSMEYTLAEAFDFGVGSAFDALNLDFDTQVDLEGSISISFEFGFDPGEGLDPADAFFIDNADIQLAGSIDAALNGDFDLGFIGGSLNGGTVDLDAALDVNLPDGGDGVITLAELSAATIDNSVLAVDDIASGFAASLPIQVSLPGIDGDGLLDSTLDIAGVTAANIFDTPDFTVTVPDAVLQDFTNIKPGDVTGMLANLGAQLDFLAGIMDVSDGIPFVGEAISEVVSYTQMLEELSATLFDVGLSAISPLEDLGLLNGTKTFEVTLE